MKNSEREGWRIFRATVTAPIPAGATIRGDGDERTATWTTKTGRRTARVIVARKGKHAGADVIVTESGKWYVELADHDGKPRRIPCFTDRRATEGVARSLSALVAFRRATGQVDPKLSDWLATLPLRIRDRLADIGLIPQERASAGQPIGQHVRDWHKAQLARGVTAKQAGQARRRVEKIIDGCRFAYVGDISGRKVEQWLADQRAGGTRGRKGRKGLGLRTSNHYTAAMTAFARWLRHEGRIVHDVRLHLLDVTDAEERRPLTAVEQAWLVGVTETQPARWNATGADRAMVYRVAIATGARAGELKGLKRSAFLLGDDPPVVILKAAETKNREGGTQPLPHDVADRLVDYFAGKAPEAAALRMPTVFNAARMIRDDLRAARAAWIKTAPKGPERRARAHSTFCIDSDVGRLDFHSLRGTAGHNLANAGVSWKVTADLLRHKDPSVTAKYYTRTFVADRAAALESAMPSLELPAAMAATGTDDTRQPLAHRLAESSGRGPIRLDYGGLQGGRADRSQVALSQVDGSKTAGNTGDSETHRAGFEPATFGSVDRCSIQLS